MRLTHRLTVFLLHYKTARHLAGPLTPLAGPRLSSAFAFCRGRARQALLRLNRSLTCTASLLDFANSVKSPHALETRELEPLTYALQRQPLSHSC